MTSRRHGRRRNSRGRRRVRRGDRSALADLGIRPRRVALVALAWFALALVIDAAFERAGFVDGLVLVFGALLCVATTPRAVGLWRGTISHETIGYAVRGMSLDGTRAFTPCAIVASDGLMIAFAVLITEGGGGDVGALIMVAGGVIFLIFIVAGLCVAWLRRPRLLLPRTMRRA